MKGKVRFSLTQLIVLAVILGVVAKVTAPQFTEASSEAKVSMLIDGLEKMRAHLDLYLAQHEGSLPPADSLGSFKAAVITKAGGYSPYIKKIPVNPFNDLDTVRFDGEAAGAGQAGWRLDTKTGLFQADNNAGHAAL